jgi:gluconate 2-dehydrogenase alpha chain
MAQWYNHWFPINTHGSNYSHRNNYLDLDPNYKDAIGRPLVRMTFNFYENDWKMSAYLTEKAAQIARAIGARHVGNANPRRGNFDGRLGQTTHNTGGTIMSRPQDQRGQPLSAGLGCRQPVRHGGLGLPDNGGYNPTGTVGALAYWSARAIVQDYIKSPGPLVRA